MAKSALTWHQKVQLTHRGFGRVISVTEKIIKQGHIPLEA